MLLVTGSGGRVSSGNGCQGHNCGRLGLGGGQPAQECLMFMG